MRQESSRKLTTDYADKIVKDIESLPDIYPAWDEMRDDLLRKYYGKKPTDGIAKVLGKSASAIRNRATILGLSK